jgi:hypothetical protein
MTTSGTIWKRLRRKQSDVHLQHLDSGRSSPRTLTSAQIKAVWLMHLFARHNSDNRSRTSQYPLLHSSDPHRSTDRWE